RFLSAITDALRFGEPLYNLLYVLGIIFFCYFYTSIIFNPNEVADNMRKYGGFIPGIRPGKRTAEYVNSILTRITLVGALYLALIAIIPEFMITGFHVQNIPIVGPRLDAVLPQWVTQGLRVNFSVIRSSTVSFRSGSSAMTARRDLFWTVIPETSHRPRRSVGWLRIVTNWR